MSNTLKCSTDSSNMSKSSTDSTLVVKIRVRNRSNLIGNVVKDLKDTPTNIKLVSSDEIIYQAHIAIITECSDFFETVLTKIGIPFWCKKPERPVLKLRAVKGAILKKILEYMYEGETYVDAKIWTTFLKSSKQLRVLGMDCHVPEGIHGDIAEVTNQNGKNMIQIDTFNIEENYSSAEKNKTKNTLKHIGYLNDISGDATTLGDVQSSMVLTQDPIEINNINKENEKQELNIDVLQVRKEKEVDERERNQDIDLSDKGIWNQVTWFEITGHTGVDVPTPINSVKNNLLIPPIGNMNDGDRIIDPLDDEEKEDTEPKTKVNTNKTNEEEENPLKSSSMTDISVLDSQTDKEKACPPSKKLTNPNKNAHEENYFEDIVVLAGLPIDGHGQDNRRIASNEEVRGKDMRADTATDIETNLGEMIPEKGLEIKKTDEMGKVKRTARRGLSDEFDRFPVKTNKTTLKSQPRDSQRVIMEKEKKTVREPEKRKNKGSKVVQESNSEEFGGGNDDELKSLVKSKEDNSENRAKRGRKRKDFDNLKEVETIASTRLPKNPIAATKKAKTSSVNQINKKLIKRGADENIVEKSEEDKSVKGAKRGRKRKDSDNVKEGETIASTQLPKNPIAATKKAKTASVNQKNKKLIKRGADENIVEKPEENKSEKGTKIPRKRKDPDNEKEGETNASTQQPKNPIAATKKAKTASVNQKNKKLIKTGADESIVKKPEEDKSEKGAKRPRKRKDSGNVQEGETIASTQLPKNPIAATKKAKTESVNPKNKKLIKKGADEPTYCLCDYAEYGEMIGCDNDRCPIDWFHFGCVQLQGKPRGKWFCPKCRGNKPTVMKPKTKCLKEL